MMNLFAKIFNSPSKNIPEKVKNQLHSKFPNAKNIDWEQKDGNFEAVFYIKDIEYIALISGAGELVEYKKNLWKTELPESVVSASEFHGEIMNAIIIHRNNNIFYELILRNDKLDRFHYLMNASGEVLNSREL